MVGQTYISLSSPRKAFEDELLNENSKQIRANVIKQ